MSNIQCQDCKWTGNKEACLKTYEGSKDGDVEAVLHCPECGSESLIELTGEGAIPEPVPV